VTRQKRPDPIKALARDVSALVQVPSITGDERMALERVGELAESCGLAPQLHEYDLDALRAQPDYPGESAPRDSLYGLTVLLPGTRPGAPRFCLNGHIDVVAPGRQPWRLDAWAGAVEGGRVYGRGSVDMKGGVVAALHALADLANRGGAPGDVVLQVVASEEDGGAGTFAELWRDSDYAGALIPEPAGLAVVCAHGGSQQFEGIVAGRSTHAAMRLEGVSAIDRYVPLHHAMRAHEQQINASVDHELMRLLPLPYPISVGLLEAGEWPAQVPDKLRFAGRLGVPVGDDAEDAREAFRTALMAAVDSDLSFELRWLGLFRPSATPLDDPLVATAREALSEALGRQAALAGVPWGADKQHFRAFGIPCVMVGTTGIERAHAVDEYVDLRELDIVRRTISGVLDRFWRE
jgi:acetylornithine deacetylase